MSEFKFKGAKVRRRGNRLIVSNANVVVTYLSDGKGSANIIDCRWKNFTVIKESVCDQLIWLKGTALDGNPVETVRAGGIRGYGAIEIAQRKDENDLWGFFDPVTGEIYILMCDLLKLEDIQNSALAAGLVAFCMDPAIADFMGIDGRLCRAQEVVDVCKDSRFSVVRRFAFRMDDIDIDLGTGRRAENTARHEYSNYNAMIEANGGILHPHVYERVKLGVDRIVKSQLHLHRKLSVSEGSSIASMG
jgi:hypothetical protein